MNTPHDRKYARSHEWVRVEGGEAVIGVTFFAQEQLGDLTFADLPGEGDSLVSGKEFGVLESVKAAGDLYSPATGKVIAVNNEVVNAPALVNQDPYDKGWLIRISLEELSPDLLEAGEYDALQD